MEDSFKKAQKPWVKLLQKVDKAKSDYHTACKTEKSATNQERNATGDSSVSQDQVMGNSYLLSFCAYFYTHIYFVRGNICSLPFIPRYSAFTLFIRLEKW